MNVYPEIDVNMFLTLNQLFVFNRYFNNKLIIMSSLNIFKAKHFESIYLDLTPCEGFRNAIHIKKLNYFEI